MKTHRPHVRLLSIGTFGLALALSACTTQYAPPNRVTTLQAPPPPSFELASGDLLSVKFYNNPELNEDVTIRPDGLISLQLIGDVQAAGLTPKQLDADLSKRYKGELATPRVAVIVRKFGGHRVWVGGEVGKQGVVSLRPGMTLFQGIQEAGGLLPTAHRKQVILIRRNTDGKPTGHSIDVRPIATGVHPEEDVPLQAQDIVFVPRSKIASADLWVDQYIRGLLPTIPGVYLPVP